MTYDDWGYPYDSGNQKIFLDISEIRALPQYLKILQIHGPALQKKVIHAWWLVHIYVNYWKSK